MIDIIIPIYNSREYICNCLDSVLSQTIVDKINVYLIDDCSDCSYDDILKKYKKLNIFYYRLDKNSGPGVARQYGLDHSNGKYILFLDSDDVFASSFSVSKLYEATNKSENVIVYGYVLIEHEDGNYEKLLTEGSLHGKLFCRKVIDKYNLRFYEGYSHEDLSFFILYAEANVESIYIEDEVYIYKFNKKSITKAYDDYFYSKSDEYVNNIIWFVENCESRDFNVVDIADNIYYAFVVLYNSYIKNYDKEDSNLVIEYSSRLMDLYNKYSVFLADEDRKNLLEAYHTDIVPKISFDEFFDLVKKFND